MTIGIVGLGLIGGSIAKAIKEKTENKVLGFDIVESVVRKAKLIKAIDGELTRDKYSECDIVIIALYLEDTIEYITENAPLFSIRLGVPGMWSNLTCAGQYVCFEELHNALSLPRPRSRRLRKSAGKG